MTGTNSNGSCYWTIKEELDWFAAQQKCEERQGHLVTITSFEEHTYLLENVHLDFQ